MIMSAFEIRIISCAILYCVRMRESESVCWLLRARFGGPNEIILEGE